MLGFRVYGARMDIASLVRSANLVSLISLVGLACETRLVLAVSHKLNQLGFRVELSGFGVLRRGLDKVQLV